MTPQPDPYVPSEVATDEDVYADRTVDQLKAVIRDADSRDALSAADLRALYRYETEQKDRVTLLDFVADKIQSLGGTVPDHPDYDPESDDSAEAHRDYPQADADPDDAEADADADADAADEATDAPEYDPRASTVVTVEAYGTGYYGGEWFDSAGTKVVEWNRQLEEAVRDGLLGLVAVRDETAIPPDLRVGDWPDE